MQPMKSFRCIVLLMLVLGSCSQGRDIAGRYEATNPSGGPPLVLQLKNDGKGSWSIEKEDATFAWEHGGDEILLHSKSGGVIAGTLKIDGSIEINLPGVGVFRFLRVRN